MSDNTQNPHLIYRPDIDGLRAVAILLVIIFHAFPKFLRGGFIGVDIFFVISGYLITSIILKNQYQNNFSLVEFYSRRIKRIFPSLIVVLTFCLITGWYILLENEYSLLGKHVAAGSLYISNFILQSESGYFDIDSELKPLLHLWSLAIEEQFYLVFPLLLIMGARFHVNALRIILTCLILSFLLNVVQVEENPTEIFFFPHGRVWELLVGSLIAYFGVHSTVKIEHEKAANFLAWFGAVLIFTAWIFLDSKKILFPSWWALVPTLGAACLILAGEKAWFNRKILASKFAIFIGLISYPLYLWHWVLLSFARITEIEKPNAWMRFTLLLVSVFFAWLTYFFVEKNIRFQKSKWVSLGLLICLLVIGSVGYVVKEENGFSGRYQSSWIEGEIGNDVYRNKGLAFDKKCIDKYAMITHEQLSKYEYCLVQDIKLPVTSLLVGDSHANHFYSWLIQKKELTGGNLLNRGAAGCLPFFDNPSMPNKECFALINELLETAITTPSIKTVILASRALTKINEKTFVSQDKIFNDLEPEEANSSYRIFENGMRKTLQRLTAAKKDIVFILAVPELEFDPVICANRPWRFSEDMAKSPCAIARSQVDSMRRKYLDTVTLVLKDFPNVKVLDPLAALCDETYCWAIKDRKLLYRDDHHLNEIGAIYLNEHSPLTK